MIAFAGNGSLGVGELRKSAHVRTILIASCYTHSGWLEVFNTLPKQVESLLSPEKHKVKIIIIING